MLQRIRIENLALISGAELEFSDKLNILSGETGAGKSIIVDALMLLMGGKYDRTMLSYGADAGEVEGVFVLPGENDAAFLDEFGIERDSELIISRKFNADGRNDIRVNGKSVTLKMLRAITSHLVDICGQNEYQLLADKREHGVILDAYTGVKLAEVLEMLAVKYREYTDLKRRIAAVGDSAQRMQRIDILTYQINEIERAAVREGEEEELIDFRSRAVHGEKIKAALSAAAEAMSGENGGTDKIYDAVRALSPIASFSSEYGELEERLNALSIELDDIASTVSGLLEDVDFDESDLEKAESRLQQLRSLKKKYGELTELPDKLAKMNEELAALTDSDDEYDLLCERAERTLDELYSLSCDASELRRRGAERLERDVKNELAALGMKNSEFKVSFAEMPARSAFASHVTSAGADDIEFLLSPNPGQPLLPLVKIISGGEMSRFMLALKVISSRYAGVGTMIFDEIDTGISGAIGLEVAKKLAEISRHSQVLCVTHLPQIASMADRQYFIEKSSDGTTTRTGVRLLDRAGMIDEISRLSGARGVSSAAKRSAEELKDWSDGYKAGLV